MYSYRGGGGGWSKITKSERTYFVDLLLKVWRYLHVLNLVEVSCIMLVEKDELTPSKKKKKKKILLPLSITSLDK